MLCQPSVALRPRPHRAAARATIDEALLVKYSPDFAFPTWRHGGMTELGDAEFAEQGVMALSGHRTPQAARLYVKRTEHQRVRAAAKRRSFVEANETETRVDLEQKDRTEPFKINGASYGGRTRLFRLKISSFSNGFNWLCTFAAQTRL